MIGVFGLKESDNTGGSFLAHRIASNSLTLSLYIGAHAKYSFRLDTQDIIL